MSRRVKRKVEGQQGTAAETDDDSSDVGALVHATPTFSRVTREVVAHGKGRQAFFIDPKVKEAVKARLGFYYSKLKTLNEVANSVATEVERDVTRLAGQMQQGVDISNGLRRNELLAEAFRRMYIRKENLLSEYYKPQIGTSLLLCGNGDCSQLGALDPLKVDQWKQKVADLQNKAHDQDGDDDDDDVDPPHTTEAKRPQEFDALKGVPLVQIAGGGIHTLILCADGRVMSWGCNDDGPLGRDTDAGASVEYLPEFVAKSDSMGIVNRIDCGDCQSLALTVDGKVFMWGCYKDKAGTQFRDVPANTVPGNTNKSWETLIAGKHTTPVCTGGLQGKHVQDIKCGASFNAALTSDGELFTWGLGQCGELGRPPPTEKEYELYGVIAKRMLTPLPPLWADGVARTVESVACGGYHILVTTIGGAGVACAQIFSAGLNNYGQLGHDDVIDRTSLTRITALDKYNIHRIAAGQHHSLCTDQHGNLIAFGRGDSGQLGITNARPETGYYEPRPVKVELGDEDDNNVVQISCGANHNIAITTKGSVYSWGYGDLYALGHGVDRDEYMPRKLDVKRGIKGAEKPTHVHVYQAAGGGQHTALLCTIIRENEDKK